MKKTIIFFITLITIGLVTYPTHVKADLMPIEVYSTNETVKEGTISFLFARSLGVKESFYLEYDEKDLEYIQNDSLSPLYKVENSKGRLTVSFKTGEVFGDPAQLPYLEFKVLSTDKDTIEVKIDSDNEGIKTALHGGLTKEIKINNLESNNNIIDSDINTDTTDNSATDKEDNDISKNDIILYVSLGVNTILLITTLIIALRKKQ